MTSLCATFITIAKEPLSSWCRSSIIGRAHQKKVLSIHIEAIADNVKNGHIVDDAPYGGGPGELLKIDVIAPLIDKAISLHPHIPKRNKRVLLMDPAGKTFVQED